MGQIKHGTARLGEGGDESSDSCGFKFTPQRTVSRNQMDLQERRTRFGISKNYVMRGGGIYRNSFWQKIRGISWRYRIATHAVES